MASPAFQLPTPLPKDIRAALARGWRLLPVLAHGKTPLVQEWPKVASGVPGQVEAWAAQFPGCNWATATGSDSGIFVMDVDGESGIGSLSVFHRQGKELPDTLSVSTGRGSHLYFRWPKNQNIRNSAGKVAKGIDIRGEGGYVVIPPSIHPSGILYAYDDAGEPIAKAPKWLLEMAAQPARSIAVTSDTASIIGPGRRTPLLFSMAGKLHSLGVPPNGILAALRGLNATFAPPHDEGKLVEIANGIRRYPEGHLLGILQPDLLCLADIEARPVPWLWKMYLAFGMVSMLSGDPDAGKTFIALAIAAELSKGSVPVSGEPCAPISTLYLSNENSAEHVLRPRFNALGGDASRFHLLKGIMEGAGEAATRSNVTLKDVAVLKAALQKTEARLIVIDPIQSYLGSEVDLHRSNETRPILDGLIDLAEGQNACCLVVRHLTKAGSSRAIHRGLGSIDLTGAVRMEMIAGSAAGDPTTRALVQIKNNLGPRASSLGYRIVGSGMDAKLEWLGRSELTAEDLLAADAEAEGKSDIAEAVDFLKDQLKDGSKLAKDLEEGGGFAERTLQRAAKRIGVKKNRDGSSGPWRWSLK